MVHKHQNVAYPRVKSFQDMPPPGGYPTVNLQSRLRPRGPSGAFMWAALFGTTIVSLIVYANNQAYPSRVRAMTAKDWRLALIPYYEVEKRKQFEKVAADAAKKSLSA